MDNRFIAGSVLHFLVLFISGIILAILVFTAKKRENSSFVKNTGYTLAFIQIINSIVYIYFRISSGFWELRYDLPLEFCNWSMIVTTIALINHNRTMAELSYFWVMGVSIQGIITPDLTVSYPHIYFFIFFISHAGLVIASMFLVISLGLTPRPGSVKRAFLYGQIYLLSALIANIILDSNYGYIMRKPDSSSFMVFLGEWPYYLLNIEILVLVLFGILYLPFAYRDLKLGQSAG